MSDLISSVVQDDSYRLGILDPISGNYVVKYVFNDTYASWTLTEMASVRYALDSLEMMFNLEFQETTDTEPWNVDVYFEVDALVNAGGWNSITETISYNKSSNGWSTSTIMTDGWGYQNIVHEILHSLGLKHPWSSGEDVIPGASETDVGVHGLNHVFYTTMSYTDSVGAPTTPMAIDIAALGSLYGFRNDLSWQFSTGTLDLANLRPAEVLTVFGDIHTLQYSGEDDATLDLRSATLEYEVGGGGFVSTIDSYDTFERVVTIANHVDVENATGGSGNDNLIGNHLANTLIGNAGNDVIQGGAGNDTLVGGIGTDTAIYRGAWAEYGLRLKSGVLTVDDKISGRDGKDTIQGIEKLRFANDIELTVAEALNVAPDAPLLGPADGNIPVLSGLRWLGALNSDDPNNDNSASAVIDAVSFSIKAGQANGDDYVIVNGQLYEDSSVSVDPVAWKAAIQAVHASVVGSAMSFDDWMWDIADGHSSISHAAVISQLLPDYKVTVTATDLGGLKKDNTLILQFPEDEVTIHTADGVRTYYGWDGDNVLEGTNSTFEEHFYTNGGLNEVHLGAAKSKVFLTDGAEDHIHFYVGSDANNDVFNFNPLEDKLFVHHGADFDWVTLIDTGAQTEVWLDGVGDFVSVDLVGVSASDLGYDNVFFI